MKLADFLKLTPATPPHLFVPLGRPDARVFYAFGFVIGTAHVEVQAVLVDENVAEDGAHALAGEGHGIKQHLLLFHPGDGVAVPVAGAGVPDLDHCVAQVDRQAALEAGFSVNPTPSWRPAASIGAQTLAPCVPW